MMPPEPGMLAGDSLNTSSPSRLHVRTWMIVLLVGAAVWAIFAWGIMPSLIRKAIAGEHVPILSGAFNNKDEWPVEHYLGRWSKVAALALAGWLGAGAMILITSSRWFARRFVGAATPGTLGALRMFLCLLAAYWAFKTDLARVASLPHSQRIPMGFVNVLYNAPLALAKIDRSAIALHGVQAVTVAALLLAAVGFKTRWTLAAGAALYLIVGGMTRSYSKFGHAGLVPLYTLAVLCFTRCGDGWSLDRLIRQWRGQPVAPADAPDPRYAWGRYVVWTVVAVSYVCAGLSKLFNGSLLWWSSTNMQRLLYEEAFGFGAGDHDLALKLLWVPTAAFALMGIGTLVLELGMGLALFSRWARRLLPPMVALMHLGIDVFQRIPFYDLFFIQAIFYDWGVLRRRLGRTLAARRGVLTVRYDPQTTVHQRWARILPGLDLFGRLRLVPATGSAWTVEAKDRTLRGVDAARAIARIAPAGWLVLPLLYLRTVSAAIGRWLCAGRDAGAMTITTTIIKSRRVPRWRLAPIGMVGLIVLFLGAWAVRVEAYPLTSWQMFSNYKNTSVISYYKLYQTNETGRTAPAEPSQISAIGPHGYISLVLWRGFRDQAGEKRCRELLAQAGGRWNKNAAPGQRLTELKVVRREWDFVHDRHNPKYGRVVESLTVTINSADTPARQQASR